MVNKKLFKLISNNLKNLNQNSLKATQLDSVPYSESKDIYFIQFWTILRQKVTMKKVNIFMKINGKLTLNQK